MLYPILFVAIGITVGAFGTAVVLDPTIKYSLAQKAVMQQYLNHYCYRLDDARSVEWSSGRGAVLSTLTIQSGIGEIALSEYAKCKLYLKRAWGE